ncbi:MAG: hypothetical protein HZB53_06105 [Chloroflexi bacterium]|nr:hypothetical protein [Chloroflexota bacterium]
MNNSLTAKRARRQVRLHDRRISDPVSRLALATLGTPSPATVCDQYQSELASFIDLELAGHTTDRSAHQPLMVHLATCMDCMAMYVELLESGVAELHEEYAADQPVRLDLKFLNDLL